MVHAVRVVELSSSHNLVDLCLQETGGLGVHCIIDSGGNIKSFIAASQRALVNCNMMKKLTTSLVAQQY